MEALWLGFCPSKPSMGWNLTDAQWHLLLTDNSFVSRPEHEHVYVSFYFEKYITCLPGLGILELNEKRSLSYSPWKYWHLKGKTSCDLTEKKVRKWSRVSRICVIRVVDLGIELLFQACYNHSIQNLYIFVGRCIILSAFSIFIFFIPAKEWPFPLGKLWKAERRIPTYNLLFVRNEGAWVREKGYLGLRRQSQSQNKTIPPTKLKMLLLFSRLARPEFVTVLSQECNLKDWV